jgi:DNA-binding NarL/FixJ family response regulator
VISVVLVDDQDLVREGLRMLLQAERDLCVTGEAGDGRSALAEVRRVDPDVVLMDVRMPELDGIEATAQLVRSGCRARILMLTTFDFDEYVYRAMKVGASGFLLKDATRVQLAEAVRTVSAGDALLAPAITKRLIEDFCSGPAPGAGGDELGLSGRELEVCRLVARGLSNIEIAAELYVSGATVKTHVAHVLTSSAARTCREVVARYSYARQNPVMEIDSVHSSGTAASDRPSVRSLGDGTWRTD